MGATLDRTRHTISFSVNGVDHGVAFALPFEIRRSANLFPAITIKGCAVRINLGQEPLRHCPPDATPFATAGRVDTTQLDETADRGQVIGRTWNVRSSDTSSLPSAWGSISLN